MWVGTHICMVPCVQLVRSNVQINHPTLNSAKWHLRNWGRGTERRWGGEDAFFSCIPLCCLTLQQAFVTIVVFLNVTGRIVGTEPGTQKTLGRWVWHTVVAGRRGQHTSEPGKFEPRKGTCHMPPELCQAWNAGKQGQWLAWGPTGWNLISE